MDTFKWIAVLFVSAGLIMGLLKDDPPEEPVETPVPGDVGGVEGSTPTASAEEEEAAPIEEPAMIAAVVIEPEFVRSGSTATAVITSGPGMTMRYEWELNGRSGGLQIENSFSGPFKRGDRLRVIVTPYSAGLSGIPMASSTIEIANSAPVFRGGVGQGFALDGHTFQVEDADGDTLTYSLEGGPPGLSINSSTGKLSFVPQVATGGEPQSFDCSVTVDDGHGAEVKISFPITIQ